MNDVPGSATEFERLFRAVYLGLHRRDEKQATLTGASRAVLTHLSFTGPLTIGEAAQHLDRAQSVVSDIVSQLEAKGLLERRTDPADRRRSLAAHHRPAGRLSSGPYLACPRLHRPARRGSAGA